MSNKRLLVFGTSTSTQSINKTFAWYTAQQLQGVDLQLVDLYPKRNGLSRSR